MRILIFIMLMSFPCFANAGDYNTEIAKFFNLYESGKKIEAIDTLYSTNPWMSKASDAIQNIKTQLQGIEKIVGNYNGKELLGENNIKNRFVHVTYIALYDRQPVRMEFQFYRPKNDWIIYSFAYDINFDDEIEKGAREKISHGM